MARMKKILAILLLITVTAVACRKEIVETKGKLPIGFSTLVTRGTVMDVTGVAAAGGFNVWGYSHVGNWALALNPAKTTLFNGSTVTSADGINWDYGTLKSWPNGENVTFFAYAPAGSATSVSYSADLVPEITYSVPIAIANQIDLLIANEMLDCTGPNPVQVIFEHALSRIKFSALKAPGITGEVKITEIKFKNLYYEGSTPLEIPVNWNVNPGVRDYTLLIAAGLIDVSLENYEQVISANNGMLFLMPQELQRLVDIPEITVTFTVDGQPLSWSGVIFPSSEWLPGKSYAYQLFIDGESVQVIVKDVIELEDWETERVMQTVALGSDHIKNQNSFNAAINAFNTFKSSDIQDEYKLFTIYAAGDLNHDIEIDMSATATNYFGTGDTIVFDFEANTGNWGTDASNGNAPWEVKIVNTSGWSVTSTSLTNKGTMTLIKN